MDEVPAVPRRTSEQIFLPCRGTSYMSCIDVIMAQQASPYHDVFRRHYGSERVKSN